MANWWLGPIGAKLGCGRSRGAANYCTTSLASSAASCIGFGNDGEDFLALYQRGMEIYRVDVASGKLFGRTKLADVVEEKSATHYSISEDGLWLYSVGSAPAGLRLEYRDWKAAISKGVEI